ncbi:MAG: T9SS type A sorting domain-containing protein, partial [Cytophagales bacterium]|nr:T9SS type A sorting domain-containing protein [Cytophagales bacterium]
YFVIVSKTSISNPSSKLNSVKDAVSGLVTGQASKSIASGQARTAVFTDLDAGTNYYVYVLALKTGVSIPVIQDFRAETGEASSIPAPTKPALAKDATDTASGSLTLKQTGNVPAGETYFVIISKTEISDVGSKIVDGAVTGLGAGQVSKKLASGDARTAVFTGLTAGFNYYVYAVAVKGTHKVLQDFRATAGGTTAPKPKTEPKSQPDAEPSSTLAQQGPSRSLIYPNPSRGVVYVSDARSADVVVVYSGSGVFLGRYTLSLPGGGIDLSALNAGLYILEHNGIRHRIIIE